MAPPCAASRSGSATRSRGRGAAASTTQLASGTNFNLAIDEHGDVWAWGWSEYGVLGAGTDGAYNTKEGAIKMSYTAEYAPRRVPALLGKKCLHVACGQHHCAAIDGEGVVYTWGEGGYGRLGHRNQADVWTPKPLAELRARAVTCGAVHTAALGWAVHHNGAVAAGAPGLWMWGRVKSAQQNAWMYPQQEEDLRGWDVHAITCGASHNVAHADSSVISWGAACQSGELGLIGKKSSSRPAKVEALEGVAVAQVACGLANTILLVEASPTVEALPEWTPVERDEEEAAALAAAAAAEAPAAGKGKAAAKGKRPAAGAAAGGGGKKGKA